MKNHYLLLATLTFLTSCSDTGPKGLFYGSCAEIRNQVLNSELTMGSSPMASQGAAEDGNAHLNLQETGVDEADFFRTDQKLVFVAHEGGIEVFKRNPLKKLGYLAVPNVRMAKLYAKHGRLILVGLNNSETLVKFYSFEDAELPTLTEERSFKGNLIESRLQDHQLTLVLKDYDGVVGWCGTPNPGGEEISGVPCTSIIRGPQDAYDFTLTKVITLNIQEPNSAEGSLAFLGGAQHLYMSALSLYVASSKYPTTVISKVNVKEGGVNLESQGEVEGYVKDRWAFKEYAPEGVVSVVSTTYGRPSLNYLSVLAQKANLLETVAKTPPFGHGEDIRAVRFVGEMAYAVTFKKTDPLFAIDMSNPLSPQLKGELVIPGFSSYLHPWKEGRLIGVGFDATDMGSFAWFGGVQISLFNTADPMNLTRLDNKVIGVRGSFADPATDAHAFYTDSSRNRIGVPVVELKGENLQPNQMGTEVKFSGAILYEVNDSLKETHRLSHSKLLPSSCLKRMTQSGGWLGYGRSYDINRLISLDGELLSVSRFGLVRHCHDHPQTEVETFVFSKEEEEKLCKLSCYSC